MEPERGTALTGETTNSITFPSATPFDAGTYTVVTTGAANSVTNTALVTVNTGTTASALTPVNGGACPGGSVTYSTVASGTGPFTYQWNLNGTALTGQTTSSITLASVSLSDAGTYSVLVTGTCNGVTNSTVLVVNTVTTATASSSASARPRTRAIR